MKKALLEILFILVSISLWSQSDDWFHLSVDDGHYGSGSEKSYQTLLKNKTAQTVIVAVIDSGVDAEHEDLKDVMWTNPGEIPGNNKDDDGNGYIDDVHGWNFIGGPDGNVNHDTYEVTRLYGKYKYRYEQADESKLSKDQLVEFRKFKKYKEEVEKKRNGAQSNLDRVQESLDVVSNAIGAVESALDGKELTMENLDSLETSADPNLNIGKNIVAEAIQTKGQISLAEIKSDMDAQFAGARDHYQGQLDYAYNPDYNPRTVIGDNYDDPTEKYYGNNDVEGPDARHGTHVAGIIAATRNNDIGMDGVADNVQIMSIRTVPNGDERDKDVANAIRYAVDNGASIINMSFGKGYGTEKNLVDDAMKYAAKKDVLLVHAAGNSSQNNDTEDNFPNDAVAKKKLFGCKKINTWVEVGALNFTTDQTLVASFSNYGKQEVDIFAPGVQIYSTVPNDKYEHLRGTSMAAPVVAGVAAILRSYYPALSATQVKEILMESSNKINESVVKPGSDDMVSFKSLSVSGGAVDTHAALKLAASTKGKKKIKKSNRA